MVSGTWHYRYAARVGAGALILTLAACSSLNPVHLYRDIVHGGSKSATPPADSANLDAGSEEPYPNLAGGAGPGVTTVTQAQQAAMKKGLISDRAHANYADQEAQAAPSIPAIPQDFSSNPAAPVPSDFTSQLPPPLPSPAVPHHVHKARMKKPHAPQPESALDKELAASGLSAGGAFGGGGGADASARAVTPRESPQPESGSLPPGAPDLAPTPTASPAAANHAGRVTAPEAAAPAPSAPELTPVAPPSQAAAVGAKPVKAASIHFAAGTTALPANVAAVLAPVVKLQQAQGGVVHVVSHAAASGDAAANLALYQDALARANAVRQALIARGVPAASIVPEVSSSAAAASGDTVEVVVRR